MTTGQTLLTLAAIVLLAIISMGIRGMYLQSVKTSVDTQFTSDALNFGRDLSERVHRHSGSQVAYNEFFTRYGNCIEDFDEDDIDLEGIDNNCKVNYNSVAGEHFIGLITIPSNDDDFDFGVVEQEGRFVNIRVFREKNDEFVFDAKYKTIVTDF